MQIDPYLSFDGRCAEAFGFYAQLFGGEIVMQMTYGESPAADQAPAGFGDKIMHARVTFAGQTLMGADSPPGRYETPRGITLSVGVADEGEAKRIFDGLAAGGTVHMPLQKTFWAAAFGMLADRFGISWMVNCEAAG